MVNGSNPAACNMENKMNKLLAEAMKKQKCNCSTVTSIQDINDQFDYEDTIPGGDGDNSLVSCGQDGNYNELEYIYDQHLKLRVLAGTISKDQAIQALCKACCELESPRSRDDFYDILEQELGITIER